MINQNKYQIGRRSFLKITAGAAIVSGIGLPKKFWAERKNDCPHLLI